MVCAVPSFEFQSVAAQQSEPFILRHKVSLGGPGRAEESNDPIAPAASHPSGERAQPAAGCYRAGWVGLLLLFLCLCVEFVVLQ